MTVISCLWGRKRGSGSIRTIIVLPEEELFYLIKDVQFVYMQLNVK